MGKRTLAENSEPQKYFEEVLTSSEPEDDGKRDMGPLYPFLICGGKNTERWYFVHINDITDYKFNIKPEYFGYESNYTDKFPDKISEVLKSNAGAKVFCVFDWDTIHEEKSKIKKHEDFERLFETEIAGGSVVVCQSMPCIEYWFLLHFKNDTTLYKTYSNVSNKLPQEFKGYFPNPKIKLKKLLKQEKYLKDSSWVQKLCSDGKLDLAIERAENNIAVALLNSDLDNQSYTYIYKIFKS